MSLICENCEMLTEPYLDGTCEWGDHSAIKLSERMTSTNTSDVSPAIQDCEPVSENVFSDTNTSEEELLKQLGFTYVDKEGGYYIHHYVRKEKNPSSLNSVLIPHVAKKIVEFINQYTQTKELEHRIDELQHVYDSDALYFYDNHEEPSRVGKRLKYLQAQLTNSQSKEK